MKTEDSHTIQVRNSDLASILVTLGFELKGVQTYTGNLANGKEGEEITVFSFSMTSPDYDKSVKDIVNLWNDEDWLTDKINENDPLTYLVCQIHNKRRILDIVKKQVKQVIIQMGNKKVMLPSNASEGLKRKAKRFLLS